MFKHRHVLSALLATLLLAGSVALAEQPAPAPAAMRASMKVIKPTGVHSVKNRLLDSTFLLMSSACKHAKLTVIIEKNHDKALEARFTPPGYTFIKGIAWLNLMQDDAHLGYQLTFTPAAQKHADKVIPLFILCIMANDKDSAQAIYDQSKAEYVADGDAFTGTTVLQQEGKDDATLVTTRDDKGLTVQYLFATPQ